MNGYFKVRYEGPLEELQPSWAILARKIPFKQIAKTGLNYQFPVRVKRSMGATFNGGSTFGDAFGLNAVKSGVTVGATATATEYVLRDAIAYDALSSAMDTEQAFGNAFDETIGDMTESAMFMREATMLYGGTSIGAIDGAPVLSGGNTIAACTISLASWAPGLWIQEDGGYVDVYDATLTTKRNALADVEVTGINSDTRVVTLLGNATDIASIVTTDVFVFKGANGNWFNGMDKIMTNTGSLFGIDAATYSLWRGSTYSVGGAATMAKFLAAAARVTNRSGQRDLEVLLSTATWTDLNVDLAALRRYTESTKGAIDIGTEGNDAAIRYYGPNGTISLTPHSMVKSGEAFMWDPRAWVRRGATDLTFKLPNAGEDEFLHQLENNAGIGVRCYWNQFLLCRRPNTGVKLTGIVNVTAG
jgi:hypothetical protein